MPDWSINGDGQYFVTMGADTAASAGTLVASTATGGTYGSWTQIGTATTIHASGFLFNAGMNSGLGKFAVDIGVGATSVTVTTIVQRIQVHRASYANGGNNAMYFPLEIPAGSLLWIRQCSEGTAALNLLHTITLIGTGFRPSRSYTKCTTYNIVGGLLNGESPGGLPTPLTFLDPGVSANTPGNWTDVTGITTATGTVQMPISSILLVIVPLTTAVSPNIINFRYSIDVGVSGGTPLAFGKPDYTAIPNLSAQINTNQDNLYQNVFGPMPLSIPAGSRIWMRATRTETTAGNRSLSVGLYAFS